MIHGSPEATKHRDLPVPAEVRRIARRLEEAGFPTWAVGGAVRDALTGLTPGDWDLATAARPHEVRQLFRRTVPIGIEHGTVGVLGKDGEMYEVTTFRRDVETFGRRAKVSFADTLEEDLERRDFTINAVAWHPLTHEIRDPHGGADDLRAGVLRTVGEAAERFREDRLRVLRALRFAGRFDLRIDAATWRAVQDAAGDLQALSAERVREELFKVLRLSAPSKSLRLYAACGILRELYPELQACVGVPDSGGGDDVWTHLLRTVDVVPRHRYSVRLAALLHDIGKPSVRQGTAEETHVPGHAAVGAAMARAMLKRLKCSNREVDDATHLVAQHSSLPAGDAANAEIRRWVRLVGPEYVPDLLRLRFADCRARGRLTRGLRSDLALLARRARQVLRERTPMDPSELAIGGAELRSLGLPPGPVYGDILRDLLERVMDDPSLNTPEALLRIVQEDIS
jgi:tRNA nucleotidyltransferase (CCA-adding enzyme)